MAHTEFYFRVITVKPSSTPFHILLHRGRPVSRLWGIVLFLHKVGIGKGSSGKGTHGRAGCCKHITLRASQYHQRESPVFRTSMLVKQTMLQREKIGIPKTEGKETYLQILQSYPHLPATKQVSLYWNDDQHTRKTKCASQMHLHLNFMHSQIKYTCLNRPQQSFTSPFWTLTPFPPLPVYLASSEMSPKFQQVYQFQTIWMRLLLSNTFPLSHSLSLFLLFFGGFNYT